MAAGAGVEARRRHARRRRRAGQGESAAGIGYWEVYTCTEPGQLAGEEAAESLLEQVAAWPLL